MRRLLNKISVEFGLNEDGQGVGTWTGLDWQDDIGHMTDKELKGECRTLEKRYRVI